MNNVLNDEHRHESIAVRGLKKQLLTMEEINQKQEDLIKQLSKAVTLSKNSMEENLISMALPFLLQKFGGENKQPIQPMQEQNPLKEVLQPMQEQKTLTEFDLTDEQIKAIIQSKPELKQHSKQFTDEDIEKYLKTQIPNISENSIKRIITAIRS